MKRLLCLAATCLTLTTTLSSAASVSYARWRGGKTAAYSINMDDYGTQYFGDLVHIDSTLDNRGLNVSFATVANWSSCNTPCQNANWGRAGTMLLGNEFICHTMTHPDQPLTDANYAFELDSSQALLEEKIPTNQCMFLIFSGGSYSDGAREYLRTARYIGCQSGGGGVNPPVIADPYQVKASYYAGGGVGSLNSLLDDAIPTGGWTMRSCHNVGSGGWMPISMSDWNSHLNYCVQKVNDGSIWMAPVQEVLEYALEREAFPVAVTASDAQSVEVTIDTAVAEINASPKIHNRVYDTWLTLIVDIDFAADGAVAMQADSLLPVIESGANHVMVDADPWGGPVTVYAAGVPVLSPELSPTRPVARINADANGVIIENAGAGQARVSILELTGRAVLRTWVTLSPAGHADVRTNLTGGQYIVEVTSRQGTTHDWVTIAR